MESQTPPTKLRNIYKIYLNEYRNIKLISKGGFGSVYLVKKKNSKEYYAAKTIEYKKEDTSYKLMINREISIMMRISHPTLIRFYGYSLEDFEGKKNVTIIMEYFNKGSLANYLDKARTGDAEFEYDDTQRQIILIGTAYGMSFLHKNHLIHRDLKPSNILLDDDLNPHIIDFGLSKFYEKGKPQSSKQLVGTKIYMAPETIKNHIYNEKTDVYAFGILMFEVVTNKIPYPKYQDNKMKKSHEIMTDYTFFNEVIENNYRPDFSNFPVKESIKKLIKLCWSQNPDQRPTFDEIFNKLAFNDENWIVDVYEGIENENEYDINKYFLDNVNIDKVLDYIDSIRDTSPIEKLKKENEQLKHQINELQKVKEEQNKQIKELQKSNETQIKIVKQLKTKNDIQSKQIKKLEEEQSNQIQNLADENKQIKRLLKKIRGDSVMTFHFYFTGGSSKFMQKGIEVELDTSMTPDQVENYLQSKIDLKIDMKNKQLIIYLSGGLPFYSGTLGDIYLNKEYKFSPVIYGIVTRRISKNSLDKNYTELCNVIGNDRKLLISPLCDSTDLGLSDIACLLGYLNHEGAKNDLLLRTFAAVINFPPLITSMKKIICHNNIVGRDIIAVTSTLYTFFRNCIPSITKDEKVFEYALRLCNLISRIENPPENLPIQEIVVKNDNLSKLFSRLELGPIVYLWKGDIGEIFNKYKFEIEGEKQIIHAFNVIDSFKPISPSLMNTTTGCGIVKGKKHEYLYLLKLESKKVTNQTKVYIIDPFVGSTRSFYYNKFVKDQENDEIVNVDDLIDPKNVSQILMINFDESNSMNKNLNGNPISKNSPELSRFAVSYQYFTTFANRMYSFHIPSIQGFISFGSKITVRSQLGPVSPDFDDKCMREVYPNSKEKRLLDSLDIACMEIINFRKDKNKNEKFQNAYSRILVFTDGEKDQSKSKTKDIVSKLINNEIIVDCIITNTIDNCKELAAICHMTGGICFKPNNINVGLSLFEQNAFLNISDRKINGTLNLSVIPNINLLKAYENATFDTKIQSKEKERSEFTADTKLATPAHICSINRNKCCKIPRQKRILYELYLVAKSNIPEDSNYDPELMIFPLQSCIDRWEVFIKGLDGYLYEKKWWHFVVTFPDLYPTQPPDIRCISIPYHLNISLEGKICFDELEKNYNPSKHVVEYLEELKELFILPNLESANQLEKLDLFINNPKKYEKLARQSVKDHAKKDYTDFLKGVHINDTVDEDFKQSLHQAFDEDFKQFYEIIPTRRPHVPNIKPSSGVYYDRDELRQLIASNRNPVCIITGKYLTEKLEDSDSDAI